MISNKKIENIINKHFKYTPEYKAAFELWYLDIRPEDLTSDLDIPDPIRIKVMNALKDKYGKL